MLTPAQKIKIIITDDHEIFRKGIKTALAEKTDIECIDEAIHGQDLLDKLEYLQPDIVITGLNMPVMNGIQLLPILKERYPAIKIIMLTMMDDTSTIKKVIGLGANAYLTKTTSAELLYDAIIDCSKSWLHMNDTVWEALIKERPGKPGTKNDFNTIELIIMDWYCKNITITDIATSLNLSARTLTAVLDRIFFKTKTTDAATLAKFAEERGVFKN